MMCWLQQGSVVLAAPSALVHSSNAPGSTALATAAFSVTDRFESAHAPLLASTYVCYTAILMTVINFRVVRARR